MKLLLDADVLLDIALDREAFFAQSSRVLEWCQKTPGSAVVAWHTVSNIYYVLRAARSDAKARTFISDMLRFATVASGGTEAVSRALALRMADFEDSLQVVAALSQGVELIITRNIRDYRGAPLPAVSPQDFLTRFLPA